jgi:hypothetical protein
MLWYALTQYHATLKSVLEKTLEMPDLLEKVTEPDKKGKLRPNKFKVSKLLYTITPRNWELAPLRDYLIGDASAMMMSHLSKSYKGANESNPPTIPSMDRLSEEEFLTAYNEFTDPLANLEIKPQHQAKIDNALNRGETNVAKRLSKIYSNWAISRAAGLILRKLDGALPHPIEFTRNEFSRGCLLAYCDGNYYLMVRLFRSNHRYCEKLKLNDGFIDCKSHERIEGKIYPGLILPLEMNHEFHVMEYLTYGSIQSAKLIVKRKLKQSKPKKAISESRVQIQNFNAADFDFFVHIAFEFKPEPIKCITFMGIDRGAVKLGAATLIDQNGKLIQQNLDLDGVAFATEMRNFEEKTRQIQKTGKQRSRKFSLRGKRSDIILGEYANRIVNIARTCLINTQTA